MQPTSPSNCSLEQAINSRNSVRSFRSDPVQRDILINVLEAASRSPSGTNTQPWKVYVLEGDKKDVLISQVCTVHDAIAKNPELASEYPASYAYYPNKWVSPYIDRRRENGWSLYNLLGIKKGEKDKMHLQHQRNFQFFGAPVGLIFTMYKDLGTGAFLDYGMFLQNLMLAAQAYGLSTCPQGAWVSFFKIVMPFIGAGEDEFLVCGMSLGYADQNDVVNTLKTPRESVESFTHWV